MKVFICHSSSDKWVARQISRQLEQLGATTFLDEKDLETGESIDDKIHEQLKECDELLMLLSPAALQSHWVLIEIGGAKALEKRLIPIMLNIGSNELPTPISSGLARDINEIEKYFDELKKRIKGDATSTEPPTRPERVLRPPRSLEFKVGDVVRIVERPQYGDDISGGGIGWVSLMDRFCGMVARIEAVDDELGIARLDVDKMYWGWAFEWLRAVPPTDTLDYLAGSGANPFVGPLPSLEKMRGDPPVGLES